jgi:hypothetical protein
MQTFDYPSIGAISSFIADTKYPGGVPSATAAAAAPAAPALLRGAAPEPAGGVVAGAVALTGLSLRFAHINSLTDLYRHMRDLIELHSVAPFNRYVAISLVARGLLAPLWCGERQSACMLGCSRLVVMNQCMETGACVSACQCVPAGWTFTLSTTRQPLCMQVTLRA